MFYNKKNYIWIIGLILVSWSLAACDKPPEKEPVKPIPSVPIDVNATIQWDANREKAVNSINGGYKVYYSLSSPVTTNDRVVDIPYNLALQKSPTSADINILLSGRYYFAVQAYSGLNPPSNSQSSLSTQFSIVIQ